MAPGWSSACEVGGHVIGQLDDIRLSHEFRLHHLHDNILLKFGKAYIE